MQNEFRVVVLREPMTLYRGCFGTDRASRIHALSSNYEIDRRPPHPADLHATVLHMATSGFEHRDRIAHMARRRPDRIGTHIATLELQPGHGVCVADTGGPGHWSVWGIPTTLATFVTAIEKP